MADNQFVSADTTKIADFERDSAEVIKEFAEIKKEFVRINSELLSTWKGVGADAYKYETDHILEKIGSLEDVLNAINQSAFQGIRSTYSEMDDELGEFNRDPNAASKKEK